MPPTILPPKRRAAALCHGENGVPTDPKIIPIIWGQQSNYLYKELHDYHSGDRNNAVMSLIAQGMALPELRQLADYFAAKTWPANPAAAAAAPPEAIAGKIEMCKACHEQNFAGGAPAPRLAGLSYEYLAGSMRDFADGKRTNNLDMPGFMKALNGRRARHHRALSGGVVIELLPCVSGGGKTRELFLPSLLGFARVFGQFLDRLVVIPAAAGHQPYAARQLNARSGIGFVVLDPERETAAWRERVDLRRSRNIRRFGKRVVIVRLLRWARNRNARASQSVC